MNCRVFLETPKRLAATGRALRKRAASLRYCSSYSNSVLRMENYPNMRFIAADTVRLSLIRSYQTSAICHEGADKEEGPTKDTEIPAYSERPEDCPEWQNPLHHNNPDRQKFFKEDFGPDEEMPIHPLPPLDGSAPQHIKELADDILHLNMLEMSELVKMVQEHFGLSDDDVDGMESMMASVQARGAGAAEAEPVEEKTAFDLKLQGFDAKAKIKVIKEVRSIAGLGLKDAKEMVESAPTTIKKGLKKEEAEELKTKLEELGATIEIV